MTRPDTSLLEWHPSLEIASKRYDSPYIVISKPASNDRLSHGQPISRVYKSFISRDDIDRLLCEKRGCFGICEEVMSCEGHPIRAFFNLSQRGSKHSVSDTLDQFLKALELFIASYTSDNFTHSNGQNYNACVATYDVQTTIRVVIDRLVTNAMTLHSFAYKLDNFITSMRPHFPALSYRRADGSWASILDTHIYTQSRPLCIATMGEFSPTHCLTPIPGSSDSAVDHLVGCLAADDSKLLTFNQPWCVGDPRQTSGLLTPANEESPRLIGLPQKPFNAPEAYTYSLFLNRLPCLVAVLGGPVQVKSVSVVNGVMAHVKLKDCSPCPYFKGVHTDILHEGLYLNVHDVDLVVTVCCSHPACKETIKHGGEYVVKESVLGATALHDAANQETLHSQRDCIQWADSYMLKGSMKKYPLDKDFLCVVAQMGAGKTEALVDLLRDLQPKSAIVISYNIELCKKLFADVCSSGLPFKLYQDLPPIITESHVVVCVNSLLRIRTSAFEFAAVDEVSSALDTLNSEHLKYSGEVASALQGILTNSKKIILLDAAADKTSVKLFVDRIEEYRHQSASWIRNNWIRETNRSAQIHVSKHRESKNGRGAVEKLARDLTYDRLKDGKNVVHISSTKAHIANMEAEVVAKKILTDPKDFSAYYCGGKRLTRGATSEWRVLRLLMYSPIISAGISFTEEHFHSLCAFIDNSRHTPDMAATLQMMFRVRCLIDGDMNIYFMQPAYKTEVPHTLPDIITYLGRDFGTVSQFLEVCGVNFKSPTHYISGIETIFDRSLIGWQVLTGFINSKNRSLVRGLEIMKNTLSGDYGIPVEVCDICLPCDGASCVESMLQKVDLTVPFHRIYLDIDDAKCARLIREVSTVGGGPESIASIRLYKLVSEWGIPMANVDKAFYDTYIADKNGEMLMGQFQRWVDSCRKSSIQLQQELSTYLEALSLVDSNIKIYQGKDAWRELQVIGMQMLELTLTQEAMHKLCVFGEVVLNARDIDLEVDKYFKRMSDKGQKKLVKMIHDQPPRAPLKGVALFRRVISKAFGISSRRGSREIRRREYMNIYLSTVHHGAFIARYG